MLSSDSGRALQWICHLIAFLAVLFLFVATAQAQGDEALQPVGNSGGSPFTARCDQGEVLSGFELWTGDHVDAIRPICIPPAGGGIGAGVGGKIYPRRFGGDGGNGPQQLVCPNDAPVVIGMDIAVESAVNNIHLFCGQAVATPQRSAFPMAAYDGPVSRGEENCSWAGSCFSGDPTTGALRCPTGLVGAGIVGRSGKFLDALGLICGAPALLLPPLVVATAEKVIKPQGRVRLPPVDLNALHARGAEIAAAEPMAAKLRNEQGEGPARRGFEIGLAAAEWNTLPGPGKQRIRDLLSPSEQPAYDKAVNFSLALYKKKIADLALRGAVIASKDQVSAEFRGLQADAAAKRGFEIGLAAAEGQTLLGPGKEKIRGALDPAEQGGYDTAVTFSIERNNNPDLARKGAAIASADPIVRIMRNSETEALFRLGFDIATGIFGDPALGALGNTSTGPGSLKIRDSLSPPAQKGFNAAVDFHLARNK